MFDVYISDKNIASVNGILVFRTIIHAKLAQARHWCEEIANQSDYCLLTGVELEYAESVQKDFEDAGVQVTLKESAFTSPAIRLPLAPKRKVWKSFNRLV